MRYLVGFVFVLALGTLRLVGCGDDEGRIPCGDDDDCPPVTVVDECQVSLYGCRSDGFCLYTAGNYGMGCTLDDGTVGVCLHNHPNGCTEELGPIGCKYLSDGKPCRSEDLREGTCRDRACGGADFCAGVVCDDPYPTDQCKSEPLCTWEGECEIEEKSCNDANPCTADRCDPSSGECFHRPLNGTSCASDSLCCFATLGTGACCFDNRCSNGVCQ